MAGVVALMLAANPRLSSPEIKTLLQESCTRIDEANGAYDADGHSPKYGFGRIDAAKAVENAQKAGKDSAEPNISGSLRFEIKGSELAILPGILTAGPRPKQKILGIRLGLKPAQSNLKLRYKINVPGTGIIENPRENEFIGAATGKQRLIGFAAQLEGTLAKDFDIEYRVRLKGLSEPISAKNGVFCGSDTKTGKTIEALSIRIRKKSIQ
jgi:hypothetical protein